MLMNLLLWYFLSLSTKDNTLFVNTLRPTIETSSTVWTCLLIWSVWFPFIWVSLALFAARIFPFEYPSLPLPFHPTLTLSPLIQPHPSPTFSTLSHLHDHHHRQHHRQATITEATTTTAAKPHLTVADHDCHSTTIVTMSGEELSTMPASPEWHVVSFF